MPSHSLSLLLTNNARDNSHNTRDNTKDFFFNQLYKTARSTKKSSRTPEVVQYRRHCASDYEQAQGATG